MRLEPVPYMCVFNAAVQGAIAETMKWNMIRLELASSWQFPRGSAGRSYLLRIPLTEGGKIDSAALATQPMRATVRRYWPNEADMVGRLVETPDGFAIQYELNGTVSNDNSTPNCDEDQLYQFEAGIIEVGEEIFLTEPDGQQVKYRVASLQ